MLSSTKNVVGGFTAGLIAMLALGSMLGLKQPGSTAAIDARVEALRAQIRDAEDQLAASKTQVAFWQKESSDEDADVVRLESDQRANLCSQFFCDRAKGLANRAANSFLDARLQEAMCSRKVDALNATLVAP